MVSELSPTSAAQQRVMESLARSEAATDIVLENKIVRKVSFPYTTVVFSMIHYIDNSAINYLM